MNLQEILKHSAIILRNDLPTFRGRTIPNKRSMLSKIATIISSSSFGAGLKMKQGYNCGFFNIVRASKFLYDKDIVQHLAPLLTYPQDVYMGELFHSYPGTNYQIPPDLDSVV